MHRILSGVLGLTLATTLAQAQQTVDTTQLDSIIRKAIAEKHIIGLSVGMMQNGRVVFTRGYGARNLETRDPVTTQTMFSIGSVTKQFTCSLLLMLNEQHKLSLDDRVAKYFPDLTRAADITLLDLGGHLSGYRDFYPLDFVDREMIQPVTADEVIRRYATRPLDFEPRSRYSYSNTGFMILGRVIEKASGEPFGSYLQQRIFTPLHLTRSVYDPATSTGDMARGYTSFALADPIPADPEARGWTGAAGAIWSTPGDLLTWDLSLLDNRLLSPASFHTLSTAQRLTDGRSSGYGCGEGVNDRGQVVVLSHGGATSGFVAQNTVIPRTRSAVVLLSNSDFSPIGALNQELVAKLIPRVDVPAIRGLSALDAAQKFLSELEKGTVDRSTLAPDFDTFLTADKLLAAQRALNAIGPIAHIRVVNTVERGGMEVAVVQFDVGGVAAQGLMYRDPDGKVEEFLFSRN
jgi:CubicO group peptidase (beta-lactamase class C family)